MGATALIAELQARGFVLSLLDDGRLRCEGPDGLALTEAERNAIREQRASIVAALWLIVLRVSQAPSATMIRPTGTTVRHTPLHELTTLHEQRRD